MVENIENVESVTPQKMTIEQVSILNKFFCAFFERYHFGISECVFCSNDRYFVNS